MKAIRADKPVNSRRQFRVRFPVNFRFVVRRHRDGLFLNGQFARRVGYGIVALLRVAGNGNDMLPCIFALCAGKRIVKAIRPDKPANSRRQFRVRFPVNLRFVVRRHRDGRGGNLQRALFIRNGVTVRHILAIRVFNDRAAGDVFACPHVRLTARHCDALNAVAVGQSANRISARQRGSVIGLTAAVRRDGQRLSHMGIAVFVRNGRKALRNVSRVNSILERAAAYRQIIRGRRRNIPGKCAAGNGRGSGVYVQAIHFAAADMRLGRGVLMDIDAAEILRACHDAPRHVHSALARGD